MNTNGMCTTNTNTTWTVPTLEEMYATCQKLDSEGKRIDAGMVAALRKLIEESGKSTYSWAIGLRVSFLTLVDVLSGKERPDGRFWDQVSRVIADLRASQEKGGAK